MKMLYRNTLTLILVFVLSRQTSCLLYDDQQLDANATTKVRVLHVESSPRNSSAPSMASSRLRAYEEASALSLDAPSTILPSDNEQSRGSDKSIASEQHQNEISPGAGSVSLASLTLYQRQHSSPPNDSTLDSVSNSEKQRQQLDQQRAGWWSDELKLPKLKPSWLNVSSQFKITTNTIEEQEFLMPAEYLIRQAFDSPILLKTKLGIVEGVRSIKFNKHLYTFLGVPYARPPVDQLRFKAPQPVERWQGVLQTTKWPPFCVQPSMTLASKSSPVHVLSQSMSEDCLYMNIWTPSLKYTLAGNSGTAGRPVMAWIHGGAFQYGGISVDENDGSALALLGNVVVVTFNYRVSAFGFLNANNFDEAPNNVGLLDQQMALLWIQQNIRQFGGDPQQVTLFGESAGAHSVGLHMISPISHQLFKRAILQSGVPISYLRAYDVNQDNSGPSTGESVSSVMMAKRLKCFHQESQDMASGEFVNATTGANLTTTTRVIDSSTTTEPLVESSTASATLNSLDSNEAGSSEQPPPGPTLTNETIACMRTKSSLEILKAMGAPGNAGFFPTGNDLRGFFPNGNIQESFDAENLKVGPQKDYLIGTNTDEGTFMLHFGMPKLFPAREPPKVSSVEALKTALQKEVERMSKEYEEHQRELAKNSTKADIASAAGSGVQMQSGGAQAHLYKPLLKTSTSMLESFMPKSRPQQSEVTLENGTTITVTLPPTMSKEAEFGKNIGSLISDIIFLCPARQLARTLSEAKRNVYMYLYNHRSSLSQYHPWIGVTHHDEVEYVFGRPLRLADVHSGQDIEMSQRLIKIWSYFAYTGQMLDQFRVEWPKYGEEDNNYMILEPNQASVKQRYHDRVCNVYDTVISVHLQDS